MNSERQCALHVCQTLERNGHQAFFVGGCVRDELLGRTPNDFDVATSALPHEVTELFQHVIPTGVDHGTVTVMVGDVPVEVTTFRVDEECDGRHAKLP